MIANSSQTIIAMTQISTNMKKLICLLNDSRWHADSNISQQLGISRNAVGKLISQLKKKALAIESTTGKGYRLSQPLVLLNETAITKHIKPATYQAKTNIIIADCVNSTNDALKNLNTDTGGKIPVYLAEQQTAGKGRRQRQWYSPFGTNIYFSCLWQFSKDISKLAGLSLAVSIAIVRTLKACGFNDDFMIKWPNDIMWQNKKLAGNLIETVAESHGMVQVIIGVGINVNMPATAAQYIDQPWTTLNHIMTKYHDRNIITGTLISHLIPVLAAFSKSGLKPFQDEWQCIDHLAGKHIRLSNGKHHTTGLALGITEQGCLQVQHPNGEISVYSSGDISS